MSRHDKALAEGVVTEQQLQQLQQQVSHQGSVLRSAKEAAKADASPQSKHQVTCLLCCHSTTSLLDCLSQRTGTSVRPGTKLSVVHHQPLGKMQVNSY